MTVTESRSLPAWPEGLKRTRQRETVLTALSGADTPMTAMQLAAQLERQGEAVWLSTIYRVLDTFVEHGVVKKTQILDSGINIYELTSTQHRHYAVCVVCNRIIGMHNCPVDHHFLPELSEQGFHVLGHRLQMYGYCAACARRIQQN